MMKHILVLTSLASLSSVYAAPSTFPQSAIAGPIGSQCINFLIRAQWLIADCLTGTDSTTRIQSAVWLDNKITNNDGNLEWDPKGQWWLSCYECKLIDGSLNCQCKSHAGRLINTTLSLDEHISVYNGHLLSDINGAPKPPSTSSSYPIPVDFEYAVNGIATCPDSKNSTQDWCKTISPSCENKRTYWHFDEPFWFGGPIHCQILSLNQPDHFQFEVLKWMGEGAWELIAYPDEACKEQPIGRILEAEAGTCRPFQPRVKAITVIPMFNGDPY
ncbi:uncharacterized protein BDR25DRAFT_340930 [Lindgomyces ingoldianus]|uniref:Uncharacterized protein n=1 Tax=Lindgomyces ingoldianus TaxID=673940 RepID=A0ACB6R3B1_9PLEO|nr:uncharacterized protein BDR25DRAFT_340930 [Lindgomyces ingoldianus]KAF2473552.1 hypothetical protein BDR25DRAFT_340930 [Lindgomyces ingoldianus]